jgi:hypothetical protein
MDKDVNGLVKYDIRLGQVHRNGLHLLCARLGMNYSQIVTLALDDYLRKKLKHGEYSGLDDDEYTNHLIGETINANRGVFGYDAEMNPIPNDKKHLLIKNRYEESLE